MKFSHFLFHKNFVFFGKQIKKNFSEGTKCKNEAKWLQKKYADHKPFSEVISAWLVQPLNIIQTNRYRQGKFIYRLPSREYEIY